MHKRNLSLVIIAALLLPGLMLSFVPNGSSTEIIQDDVAWIKATLDKTSLAGSSVSIAVDQDGFVHASYYAEATSNLRYVTNEGGVWNTYIVDATSGRGSYNSIALDDNGLPWIAYYDSVDKNLRFAKMTSSGSWEKGIIDEEGDVGRYNDMAFDSDGNPAVSYYDTNEKLKVAVYDGDGFEPEIVADMIPSTTSISFFSDGDPYVTFLDTTQFMTFAVKSNDSWTIGTVDNTPSGLISSSTITVDDVIMVAYLETSSNNLKYAEKERGGSAWEYSYADAVGGVVSSISIAADLDGNPFISYMSNAGRHLMLASINEGYWQSIPLDLDGEAGVRNAIAVNSYGKVSVVYIEGSSQYLKFVTNDRARWVVENVLPGYEVNSFINDMAIDVNGVTHIVYFNYSSNELIYADDETGAFVPVIIDTGAIAMNPSIAVDADGNAYISYYSDNHLKLATNKVGGWTTTLIDASPNVGRQSAISVNATGTIVIVYTQETMTTNNLMYVIIGSNLGLQLLSTLDGSGEVNTGYEIGMTLDSLGTVHVSYYRSQNLYYTSMSGGSWSSLTLIDDDGQFGFGTSIVSAKNGVLYISYYSISSSKGLKLATFDGDAWENDWVAKSDATPMGKMNKVVVDSKGQPMVAFDGPEDGTVRFLSWYGSLWMSTELDGFVLAGTVSAAVDPAGRVHVLCFDEVYSKLVMFTQVGVPSSSSLVAEVEDDSVMIGWQDPSYDGGAEVQGYIILRGTDATDLRQIALVGPDVAFYNDTDVDDDTTYFYAVKAFNSEGAGDISQVVTVDTPAKEEGTSIDMTLLAIVAVVIVAVVAVAFLVLNRRRR